MEDSCSSFYDAFFVLILLFTLYYSISPSTNTPGASFFGNGFVQLVMGNFSVQNYSKVVLEFRSLQRTGTLFAVHGANQVSSRS